MPNLSVRNVAIVEGLSGTQKMSFVLTLDRAGTQPITVDYYFQPVKATTGIDFDDGIGNRYSVTIPPGSLSATVDVTIRGDAVTEGNESFQLVLANIVNATFTGNAPALLAIGTILDDDGGPPVGVPGLGLPATSIPTAPSAAISLPTVSLHDATFTEGDAGQQTHGFLVTLDRPATSPVTLRYYFQSASASSARGDYNDGIANNYSLTIPAGSRSAIIPIDITGDTTREGNETFQLILADVTGGVFAGGAAALVATATIIDDDGGPATGGTGIGGLSPAVETSPSASPFLPTVSLYNATFAEGDSGRQSQAFLVTLDHPATAPMTIRYYFQSASASSARGDYEDGVANNYSLVIPRGSNGAFIPIDIIADLAAEGDETFQVVLADVTNGVFANRASALVATGTITDDDGGPATVGVGLGGLASAVPSAPSVSLTTPTVSIFSATFAEGDTAKQTQAFLVTLDRPATAPVTVSYYFQSGTASSARGDYDDGVGNNYNLVIPPGSLSALIPLDIVGDLAGEGNETFQVVLANVVGGVFAGNAQALVATGTIIDDDAGPAMGATGLGALASAVASAPSASPALPTVSLHNATFAEGDSANQAQAFLVTLDRPATAPVTLHYYFQSGSASSARGDYDDGVGNNYTLVISAGSRSAVIPVAIAGDLLVEGNETFQLVLADATNAVLAGNAPALVATATIVDDDGVAIVGQAGVGGLAPAPGTASALSPGVPTLSAHNAAFAEGDSGTQNQAFLVTLDRIAATPVTIRYYFQSAGASPANGDYNDGVGNNYLLVIPAGSRSAVIPIDIAGDLTAEGNESFQLVVYDATNAILAQGAPALVATGLIIDDDGASLQGAPAFGGVAPGISTAPSLSPTLATVSVHDLDVIEGQSGSQAYQFLITLDRPTDTNIALDFKFQSGSAVSTDFTGSSGGRLIILAGEQAATINFSVQGDTIVEGAETFQLVLSNLANGMFSNATSTLTATATIVDDETAALPIGLGLGGYVGGINSAPLSGPLEVAFDNILFSNSSDKNAAALAATIKGALSAGTLSPAGAIEVIVDAAKASTAVATLAYEFFTGAIPGRAGMDFLVSPNGPNPNNINSSYYQSFNLENRYINFAVNLGKFGEGNSQFTAEYGGLTLAAAAKKAYGEIFGAEPTDAKVSAILDTQLALGGVLFSRSEYFAVYGQDGPNGIGTKAAMVGFLLAEAVKAEVGSYARSNEAFLADAADGALYGIDLIGVYNRPEYTYFGG